MFDVSLGFFPSIDAIELRYLRMPQTFHLWKDIPDPMTSLMAVLYFLQCLSISVGTLVDTTTILSMTENDDTYTDMFGIL